MLYPIIELKEGSPARNQFIYYQEIVRVTVELPALALLIKTALFIRGNRA